MTGSRPSLHPLWKAARAAFFCVVGLTSAALPAAAADPPEATASPGIAALRADLAAAQPDYAGALRGDAIRIDTGFATLRLRHGLLLPLRSPAGRVAELLFLGQGEVIVEAPDKIEAGQLELFIGSQRLAEPFQKAVLAVGDDRALGALLALKPAKPLDAAKKAEVEAWLGEWRASSEREVLGVDAGLALDALGEPLYASFFAGLFQSERLGRFVVALDPEAEERLTLGQFVPYAVSSAKEEKKVGRILERFQRQGRYLGVELADLGNFDRWVSTATVASAQGPKQLPSTAAFEPSAYDLKITIEPKKGTLKGEARLKLVAEVPAQVVRAELHGDLLVDAVRDGQGAELVHWRDGSRLWVALPARLEGAAEAELVIHYHGAFFEEGLGSKSRGLRGNTEWYPHVGLRDLATYDLELRWPAGWDVLATGALVQEGGDKNERWQRRRLDKPAWGAGFAIGKFRQSVREVGPVKVTVALGQDLVRTDDDLDDIAATVESSLTYFTELFGPYPYDHLQVVTTPGALSQSLPGFVLLADLMMLGNEEYGELFGLEDRRSVVAHEMAHQWWGHTIGWATYRDQWISEAMANYAALLWARHKLEGSKLIGSGPTSGWQEALSAALDDGRPLESVGPLVLGERLISSRTSDAYEAIVYRKGAVVLDMLARFWGEESFVKILGAVARAAAGHAISTADFIAMVEKVSGAELDPFADQFIYATGLPEVYYDYRIEQADGKWRIHIEAEQESSFHFRWRIVQRGEGAAARFDVASERVDQLTVESSTVVVPVQVVFAGAKKAEKTRVLRGRMLLQGTQTEQTLDVDEEPARLVFDPDKVVFAKFWDRHREPKRMLSYRAYDLAAAGRADEARALLQQALQTATPVAEGGDAHQRRHFDRYLDLQVRLQLARLELDGGHLEAAATELAKVEADSRTDDRTFLQTEFRLLEARLALARGQHDVAYRQLRKQVLKRGAIDSAEGWLLLAIAARATQHPDELAQALEQAKARNADVSALTAVASAAAAAPQPSGR